MKHIRVLLCLVMLLSLVACANQNAPEEITYTVTLDFDYLGMTETQTVKAGELAEAPPHEPTKAQHINLGWFVEENGELRAWDFATDTVNADITIKLLREEQIYRYAYINGDGEGSVEVFEITVDTIFEEPRPYREGYTFLGWESQEENYQTPEGYTVNSTYIAQWHDMPEGVMVTFGAYEQDSDTSNGQEPIEWLVLDKSEDGNAYYLVSRYVLEWMPYHSSASSDGTWSTCDLRTWLNGTFLDKAFDDTQRAAILHTTRENTQTTDYVFLPNWADANLIAVDDTPARLGIMTPYVQEKEAIQRSGHHTTRGAYKGVAYWTMSNDDKNSIGGTISYLSPVQYLAKSGRLGPEGVRPAMWVSAEIVEEFLN